MKEQQLVWCSFLSLVIFDYFIAANLALCFLMLFMLIYQPMSGLHLGVMSIPSSLKLHLPRVQLVKFL